MGADLAAVDWASTPLGPPRGWPQSLHAAVSIVLSSRFPMWMAWGQQLIFFCNAAYRRNTLGTKYPWALGRPAAEVWAEIWPDIGPRIERVLTTGEATWDEGLLLFLQRSGYVEETYHTFSYSPLRDESGAVAGMLCVVSEDTERVIGARRMATLRDLGSDPTAVRTEAEVLAFAGRQLAANPRSFPFALTYLFHDDGVARLACAAGMPVGHPAAPDRLDPAGETAPIWPVAAAARGEAVVVPLADRFADPPTGEWAQPPERALVVPLPQQGGTPAVRVRGCGPQPVPAAGRGLPRVRRAGRRTRRGRDRQRAGVRRGAAPRRAARRAGRGEDGVLHQRAHEFRTPLTLLLGPIEDALADTTEPLPPAQRERTEVAARNARRLLTLVNTLLDFSRLASGRATGHFAPTDLARDTAELAAMFDTAVRRAGLTLAVDTPPLPEPVYADREMWAKIVLNLLSNAVKFTFTGGITVRLAVVDGAAELTVTDTGVGIAPADQQHLFERFRRIGGAPSRSHEGSGIGLALVAELAALHGGTVAVHSTPGEGSTFTVRVPFGAAHLPAEQVTHTPADAPPLSVADAQARGLVTQALGWLDADHAPHPAASAAEDAAPAAAAGRVLVAEDNADMRDYLTRLLAADYTVDAAVDGADALAKARAYPPDLVLTDVMMPHLDGFGLLTALRADPATAAVPVVMLSARAGEEGTVEGLEAGADDYLAKPFTARELRARVRANLELDRSRRIRAELERRQELLDQAQQLAAVGSWEIDIATGTVTGFDELLRILRLDRAAVEAMGLAAVLDELVHPDDRPHVTAALEQAMADGGPFEYDTRLVLAGREQRWTRVRGRVLTDEAGQPVTLRGSIQDITEQRAAEAERAQAAAAREAAAREHRIADELQRSLLPNSHPSPDHLQVATFYRAGMEGTQVGGDWYDVIELGAGRTGLVIGDVMGRGVQAAAVMGQLRSALRAYTRLDLPPADVLELLDAAVRDLGENQIVTCVYAIFDPADTSLTYARAGHLPPLLVDPAGQVRHLAGATGAPLGTGAGGFTEDRVHVPAGAVLALYTDGLVERRDRDLDQGMNALAEQLAAGTGPLQTRLAPLLDALLPGGPDDDVAVLLAQVPDQPGNAASVRLHLDGDQRDPGHTRDFIAAVLGDWAIPPQLADDVVLLADELVTNAITHGQPPVELRLRRSKDHLVLEVHDRATYLPRRLRPGLDDEHGRGLQLVALLTDRWGARPTTHGKAVWCVFPLDHE